MSDLQAVAVPECKRSRTSGSDSGLVTLEELKSWIPKGATGATCPLFQHVSRRDGVK